MSAVVVDGLGIVTPWGRGAAAVPGVLGGSGHAPGRPLGPDPTWPPEHAPTLRAGVVPGLEPPPSRSAPRVRRLAELALLEAAGADPPAAALGLAPPRIGSWIAASADHPPGAWLKVFCEALSAAPASRGAWAEGRGRARGLAEDGPPARDRIAGLLRERGLAGPHLSLGSSPAAGLLALGEATDALLEGRVDAALALGADSLLALERNEDMAQVGVLAERIPLHGLVPGEGAAALLLRREEDAFDPRAVVAAWGAGREPLRGPDPSDGFSRMADRGRARFALVRRVIEAAGPPAPDFVLLDVRGMVAMDPGEHWGVRALVGPEAEVVETRVMLGYLGAAAGLVDLAVAALLLQAGRARRVLVTAAGFSGDLAAVVLGRIGRPGAHEGRAAGASA